MNLPVPSPEMIAFFEQRTWEHIHRVRACIHKLAAIMPNPDELLERAATHDLSKFHQPERAGYIWVTEYYRLHRQGLPYEYPPGIADLATAAKHHHHHTNRHHIEFHASPGDMTDVDLMEMVCDWTAMAQEYGEENGSALSWATRVLGSRWHFPKPREKFIYHCIELLRHADNSDIPTNPPTTQ